MTGSHGLLFTSTLIIKKLMRKGVPQPPPRHRLMRRLVLRLPLLWSESRKHECRSFGIADDQRRVSELERVLVFICEAVFKNSIVSSTLFETCGTPCCLGADRRPPWPLPWGVSVLLGDVSGKSAFVVLATRSPSSALSSCAGRDLRVGSSLETQTVRPPRPVAWEESRGW